MREIGNLLLDDNGYVYFMADTTNGPMAGARLCRVADGVVWFWDKRLRLERGLRIDMFIEDLVRANEVSKPSKTKR